MILKLLQPALLGDTDNSGGPMLRNEIVPGQAGNLMPLVSRGDRVDGAVVIRELFVAAESADNTVTRDAGIVVAEPPAADGVSVVLFEVPGKEWVYRSEAVDYVEAYTQAGQEMDWRIFGSHLQGFKTLRLWGLLSSPLPGIGDSLFVTDETVGNEFEQPLRIQGITTSEVVHNAGGAVEVPYRDVVIELSAPLQRDINGTSSPGFALPTVSAKARKGQVSDNAKFYGVATLTQDVATTDTEIHVDSVFAAIVPASQSQQAIIDVPALPQRTRRVTSGNGYEYTDPAGPAHTGSLLITGANRSNTYSFQLDPPPAKGAFEVKLVVLGQIITLADNGDGTFGGPGQGGSGTVSDVTGNVTATLDNPPDLDTYLAYSWGSAQQWARIDGQSLPAALIDQVLGAGLTTGGEPSTLTLAWTAGGAPKSATDDGTGRLSGDTSGVFSYGSRRLRMQPPLLPDGPIDYTLVTGAGSHDADESANVTITGGRVLWTSAVALPVAPGSAWLDVLVSYEWPDGTVFTTTHHQWIDEGAGVLRPLPGLFKALGSAADATLDYATGAYSLPEVIANFTTALRSVNGHWEAQNVTARYISVHVYHSKTGGADAISGTIANGYPLTVETNPGDPVVLASVVMTLGGQTYDGGAGDLLLVDDTKLQVTSWTGGAANAPALLAGLTRGGEWTLTEMHWQALGAPLQPGSLSLRGTAAAGGIRIAATDNTGVYTGDATGSADLDTGFSVTTWAEPMDPASITHSGVVIRLIPLDKDVIGIDSARLPADGRVPIFHGGGRLAIGSSQTQTLPGGLVADQVVPLDVSKLNTLSLVDQNGVAVDSALYTADLLAGTLTMANPLDLSAYAQPLVATLRWDDYGKPVTVQGNGIITLESPMPRAYSAGDRVYSMLRMGNLQAHAPLFFDQKTWAGTFSDALSGDAAVATYNFAGFPVEVDNDSTPTERLALHVLNTSTVEVIGETMGNLGQFPIAADIAPTDPSNGLTVFLLRAGGWGSGWIPGNVLRINLQAAAAHALALRVVGLGAEDIGDDEAVLQPRGDV